MVVCMKSKHFQRLGLGFSFSNFFFFFFWTTLVVKIWTLNLVKQSLEQSQNRKVWDEIVMCSALGIQ